jgi:hypothetical protein
MRLIPCLAWTASKRVAPLALTNTNHIAESDLHRASELPGEYISADRLENCFKVSDLVEQIWVYGNSFESSLVAVVVPREGHLRGAAEAAGVQDAATRPIKVCVAAIHCLYSLLCRLLCLHAAVIIVSPWWCVDDLTAHMMMSQELLAMEAVKAVVLSALKATAKSAKLKVGALCACGDWGRLQHLHSCCGHGVDMVLVSLMHWFV